MTGTVPAAGESCFPQHFVKNARFCSDGRFPLAARGRSSVWPWHCLGRDRRDRRASGPASTPSNDPPVRFMFHLHP